MPKNYTNDNSEKEFNFLHLLDKELYTMDFHCHDFVEIYLNISGGKHFIINDKVYDINPGDLFVTGNLEVHRVITARDTDYERYVLEFKPSFALPFCTPETNLLHYTYNHNGNFSHKIALDDARLEKLLTLFHKYESLDKSCYGSDVLSQIYFIELLTFTADLFHKSDAEQTLASASAQMEVIASLLRYIGSHLTEDLCLDQLSKSVNMSKYHLCKIFKENTGTTINSYIVSRRIAQAKVLLAKGMSVTAVCESCGFHNLSHFIRTFHSLVGVSPSKYSNQTIHDVNKMRNAL